MQCRLTMHTRRYISRVHMRSQAAPRRARKSLPLFRWVRNMPFDHSRAAQAARKRHRGEPTAQPRWRWPARASQTTPEWARSGGERSGDPMKGAAAPPSQAWGTPPAQFMSGVFATRGQCARRVMPRHHPSLLRLFELLYTKKLTETPARPKSKS